MRKAYETYIFSSKIPRCFEAPATVSSAWESYRLSPLGPAVQLPVAEAPKVRLGTVLERRSSSRSLGNQEISLEQLSTLLKFSAGLRTEPPAPRGYAPSAGGIYAVGCFVSVATIAALSEGCYYYNAVEHRLVKVRQSLPLDMFSEPAIAGGASAFFLLTVNLYFLSAKYGERALRFALLECGHIAQNICLVSAALGLKHLPVGGFRDEEIEAHLGLDGRMQHIPYVVAV